LRHFRDVERIAIVVDGNLISSRHPGDLPDFCRAITASLGGLDPGAALGPAGSAQTLAMATARRGL